MFYSDPGNANEVPPEGCFKFPTSLKNSLSIWREFYGLAINLLVVF